MKSIAGLGILSFVLLVAAYSLAWGGEGELDTTHVVLGCAALAAQITQLAGLRIVLLSRWDDQNARRVLRPLRRLLGVGGVVVATCVALGLITRYGWLRSMHLGLATAALCFNAGAGAMSVYVSRAVHRTRATTPRPPASNLA